MTIPRQPLSILSGLLLATVPALAAAFDIRLTLAVLVLVYAFTLYEFQKYTSVVQMGLILICTTSMGLLMGAALSNTLAVTTAMILCGVALVIRQWGMEYFTYVRFLWFEPVLLVLAGSIFYTVLEGWVFWAVATLPFVAPFIIVTGYVDDGFRMLRRNKFGYLIKVGTKAPEIELPDENGILVRLSDIYKMSPVLLLFVRGDWCPGCHMMLRTYEKRQHEFLRRGVQVLAIGPDDISVNRDMVSRLGIAYRLLSDSHQHASDRYGVVYENPLIGTAVKYARGIPLPASFLVDVNGVVRYVSRPDRVGEFLSPELIFDALEMFPAREAA